MDFVLRRSSFEVRFERFERVSFREIIPRLGSDRAAILWMDFVPRSGFEVRSVRIERVSFREVTSRLDFKPAFGTSPRVVSEITLHYNIHVAFIER